MIKRQVIAISLAGALACSALNVTVAQEAAPGAANTPSAAPVRPGGGLVILDFKPAMDDLMTMLVQPRHLKLFYAGHAKNWTLAAFQLNELRAALARIGRTIPTYRNIGVDTAVASIFADKIGAVDAAIKAANPEKFTVAYGEMTGACNACHAAMEHPFLVMRVPDTMNYPDQDFQSAGH
jgi:hypothetical protein